MKKITTIIFVMSLLIVFNQAKSNPYLPPGPLPFPQYICVHEVTKPFKHGVSVKTYAYAYINPDMTCPPFISDYEIPENEISYVDDVMWEDGDDIWDDIDNEHLICDTDMTDACANFDPMADPNVGCVDTLVCNVADIGHDCRPGLLDNN